MSEDDLKLLDAVRTAIMAKYDYSRPEFNDGVSAALDAVVAVELAGSVDRVQQELSRAADSGSDRVWDETVTRLRNDGLIR